MPPEFLDVIENLLWEKSKAFIVIVKCFSYLSQFLKINRLTFLENKRVKLSTYKVHYKATGHNLVGSHPSVYSNFQKYGITPKILNVDCIRSSQWGFTIMISILTTFLSTETHKVAKQTRNLDSIAGIQILNVKLTAIKPLTQNKLKKKRRHEK